MAVEKNTEPEENTEDTNEEKKQVIKEAEEVYGVKKVIPSIILVENLSRNKS